MIRAIRFGIEHYFVYFASLTVVITSPLGHLSLRLLRSQWISRLILTSTPLAESTITKLRFLSGLPSFVYKEIADAQGAVLLRARQLEDDGGPMPSLRLSRRGRVPAKFETKLSWPRCWQPSRGGDVEPIGEKPDSLHPIVKATRLT
jgi:hypothetical protein